MGYLKQHFEDILSFCFCSKLKQSMGDLWFVQPCADSEALSNLLFKRKESSCVVLTLTKKLRGNQQNGYL